MTDVKLLQYMKPFRCVQTNDFVSLFNGIPTFVGYSMPKPSF